MRVIENTGKVVEGREAIPVWAVNDWPDTGTVPNAPTNLTATAVIASRIDLSWADNSGDETGFNIYRDNVLIDTVAAEATSYQDTGLTSNTLYEYYVTAVNAEGESAASNTDAATTGVIVILQPNAAAGLDTWITSVTPADANNYGTNTQLIAGRDSADRPYRGLLQFDLSSISGGATIASAILTLYYEAELNATDRDVSVHRGLVQWFEGVKNGEPPDALQNGSTWLLRNANGAVVWAGGAGGAAGSDWETVATDTTTITGTGLTFDWDVTADVAAWIGGANNYGWWIRGDTTKLIGSADNVVFRNTEHISNGRSGVSMRSYPDSGVTKGGLTFEGFYAWDISDQVIDMEPGFEPGEVIINNARIYPRVGFGGLGLTLNGDDSSSGARLIMTNTQVYGKVMFYNLNEAVINNCILDSTDFPGICLDIRKSCKNIQVGNSLLKGQASDGLVHMSLHSTGRPDNIQLNNLQMHIANETDGQGVGITAYDCQNISINNVTVTSDMRLSHAIGRRDVIGGVKRGFFAVNGLRVSNANYGVHVSHTSPGLTMTDTLSVQNSHFSNVGTAVVVHNPEPNVGKYIRDWDFSGNVYGENVNNQVVMGSVFNSQAAKSRR